MQWKTVIVTGGAGFIGSHLSNALKNKASRIVVIDKKKPSLKKRITGIIYKKMDIETGDLDLLFKKEKPDVIFHLAAHIDDRESIKRPVMNAENNILGSLRVLEAIRKFTKAKVVFASTGGVIYGNQDVFPITEECTTNPLTPYAISKFTIERYLDFYHDVYGLSYTALRFSNVYGPGQDESAECGASAIFTAGLLKGKTVCINNDGSTVRDYIFVDDVVDALILAGEDNEIGVFNISSGIGTSTVELFNMIRDSIGVQAAPDYREEVNDVIAKSILSSCKAEKELGWKAKVDLSKGIEKTVEWYSKNI